MTNKKIKFDYNPKTNNAIVKRKGIKDSFTSTDYTENNYQTDGPGNEIIGATSLEELELIDNTNNIYVDPFKPMFLAPSLTTKKKVEPIPKKGALDLTINEFTEKISNSFIGILNDLLDNNYIDISDLLLKNDRGIAVAILFIFVSLFLIFFTV